MMGFAADVVGETDPCPVDLVGRVAPQLLEDLDALGDTGGVRRLALGFETAAGIDGDAAADVGVA
jgi:hypothetical protein